MRFCISIAKSNAFHFMKQKQRFLLKTLIKPCRRPAESTRQIHMEIKGKFNTFLYLKQCIFLKVKLNKF